jgi:hypothetical protein
LTRLGALAGVLLLAACGSGSSDSKQRDASGSLQALAQGQGRTVAITPGDADFAPGIIRFSFLVIGPDGREISRPRAQLWVARGLKQRPFAGATATREQIGVPGVSDAPFGVQTLYVAHVRIPEPGKYWLLAHPADSRIAALGNLAVAKHTVSPALGAKAPRADTPTLASTHGNLKQLTTSTHPDRELYRYSVTQSLDDHVPFVLTFATPKFCASRTCGPIVDVVSRVRHDLAPTNVRFIHAEVYERNDPALGFNRWMKAWHLQSEPWVFLVDAKGRIAEKFEGSVSVRELRDAVRQHLMR